MLTYHKPGKLMFVLVTHQHAWDFPRVHGSTLKTESMTVTVNR